MDEREGTNLAAEAGERETDVVKCKQCGANLRFEPKSQKLCCDHCGSEVDLVKNTAVTENDFLLAASDTGQWGEDDVKVYRCNNCGSKQVADRTDIAMICPFCGTGNIIVTEEIPGIKPGAVFPFLITRDECKTNCKAWLKRKFFVPNEFKKRQDFSRVNGIYSPCWTFDSDTQSYYNGRLGKYYTVTVGSGKNRRTETRIRYFNISGEWRFFFDDVMVEAGPAIDEQTFQQLRPFRRDTAVVYDKKYLAGFSANHYDKDINTSFIEAKSVMEQRIKQDVLNQYTYDVVASFNCYTKHNNVTFKYVLLPIWVGHYEYNKKRYNYYINGSTGKVTGKVPRSGWKIFRFVGILLAAVGALVGLYFILGACGVL